MLLVMVALLLMLALHDRTVLEMVSLLFLELYNCSSIRMIALV